MRKFFSNEWDDSSFSSHKKFGKNYLLLLIKQGKAKFRNSYFELPHNSFNS